MHQTVAVELFSFVISLFLISFDPISFSFPSFIDRKICRAIENREIFFLNSRCGWTLVASICTFRSLLFKYHYIFDGISTPVGHNHNPYHTINNTILQNYKWNYKMIYELVNDVFFFRFEQLADGDGDDFMQI